MKVIETFETKQLENKNLANELQLITKTITLSNSKQVMEKQLKNYINYLASRIGVEFEVKVFEDEFFSDKKEDFVDVDLKNSVLNINHELFDVKTVEDFANSAKLLAEATQLLKVHQLGNYYSTENQNGFSGEYVLHLDDITKISNFVNENAMFDISEKKFFAVRTKTIKFLDDEQSIARQFGINSQFEIFEALDQMGVLGNYLDDNLQTLKDNAYREEVANYNMRLNSLAETQNDSLALMEKIKDVAVAENRKDVVLHLANLMTVHDFYSPKCVNDLQILAQKNGDEKLLSVLANCQQNESDAVILPQKRVADVVRENLQTSTQVAKEPTNENVKKYYNKYGQEVTEEISEIPALNNHSETNPHFENEYVLEEREVKETTDGKEDVRVYGVNEKKRSVLGLSEEAEDYINRIWEKSRNERDREK